MACGDNHVTRDAYRRSPRRLLSAFHHLRGRSRITGAGGRGSEPPFVGALDGADHIVSFKTGGPTGDQTLVADGNYSDDPKGVDLQHSHCGSKREGDWNDQDRGYYIGPDHLAHLGRPDNCDARPEVEL